MKAYAVQTVHKSTFLIHGWAIKPNVVCGCYPSGERAKMGVDKFVAIDLNKIDEAHKQNYNMGHQS